MNEFRIRIGRSEIAPLDVSDFDSAFAVLRKYEAADRPAVLERRTVSEWEQIKYGPWTTVDESDLLPGWALDPDQPLRYRRCESAILIRGSAVPLPGADATGAIFVLPEGDRPLIRFDETWISGGGENDDWMETFRMIVETDGRVFPPIVTRYKQDWVPVSIRDAIERGGVVVRDQGSTFQS